MTPHPSARAMLADLLPVIRQAAAVEPSVRHALANPSDIAPLFPATGGRLHLLAFGKASIEMARAAVAALRVADPATLGLRSIDDLTGVLTVVPERASAAGDLPPGLAVLPADHPLPTPRNLAAADRVEGLVRALTPADTLLVLISGGGSAHLAAPAPGLTLDDLRAVTRALQRAGATIDELNAVRKHAERLKGGRLAAMCRAGCTLALVVSDVIGDRLDVISSGPLASDASTFADAARAIERYSAAEASPAATSHIRAGLLGHRQETPKPGDPALSRVEHRIITSNRAVVHAAAAWLETRGFTVTVREGVTGEAAAIAAELVADITETARAPRAVVFGGEWTVNAAASSGLGGPSQELALASAIALNGAPVPAAIMAFSTDGIDGPTDAAGAIIDAATPARIAAAGINPHSALRDHDSTRALDAAGDIFRTGPTGANVNHIAVALRLG